VRQRRKILEQIFEIGNASLLMVCILSFFIGGVISLQTGPVLVERGLASAVAGAVGIAICKELSSVLMSSLIAGYTGSAKAAEIGWIRISSELDARRTMTICPIQYLVLPRFLAIAFGMPLLVILSSLGSWLGGALVASFNHRNDL